MNGLGVAGLLGTVSISVALLVMGLLSRRLGKATRAARYYIGFYVASSLVAISVGFRLLEPVFGVERTHLLNAPLWALLDSGLPALAVTIGVMVAWRYWSWLLAERD